MKEITILKETRIEFEDQDFILEKGDRVKISEAGETLEFKKGRDLNEEGLKEKLLQAWYQEMPDSVIERYGDIYSFDTDLDYKLVTRPSDISDALALSTKTLIYEFTLTYSSDTLVSGSLIVVYGDDVTRTLMVELHNPIDKRTYQKEYYIRIV